jgi:mannitol/fructose-specific phosphotransferase system IIA component (Ntr-type)
VNTLAEYTTCSLLLPDCGSTSAAEVIEELTAALDRAERLSNRSAFLQAVMAREQLSPTSLPIGWATPHARLGSLPMLSFALARTSHPFRWFGGSEAPMRLVWLFAVPEMETRQYLNLIAGIVRLGQDITRTQQLLKAPDALAMYDVLQQIPLRRSQAFVPAPSPASERKLA